MRILAPKAVLIFLFLLYATKDKIEIPSTNYVEFNLHKITIENNTAGILKKLSGCLLMHANFLYLQYKTLIAIIIRLFN